MRTRRTLALACLFGAASCGIVGQEFTRPDAGLPDRYGPHSIALAETGAVVTDEKWWRKLHDPLLDALVEQGLTQNFEVQAARARLRKAQAQVGTTGAPSRLSGVASAEATTRLAEGSDPQTTLRAGFGPAFLVDLFGGGARAAQRAQADVGAAAFGAESVRLAFQSEVVRTYLQLRYLDSALRAQRQSIDNRAQVLALLREQAEEQEASQLEVTQARADLLAARARIPELEADRQSAALALATLLAVPAENILHLLDKADRGQPLPAVLAVDVGYPANLLRNRPDVLQAEARLAAAVAGAGVAEADLYPTLRLGGQITLASDSAISFGPRLSVPVLDLPVRRARLAAARVEVAEAEIAWRQTVREAVEDVQVGLVRLQEAQARRAAIRQSVAVYEQALALTREARAEGLVALPELLDTQADLTESRLRLAAARRDVALAWADLQIAVGNGWQPAG